MKYLKSYGQMKPYPDSKYNIGDYVLIDKKYYSPFLDNDNAYAKIIDVAEDNNLFYWVAKLSENKILHCAEWMIIGKLTPKEVEEYELDSSANKYNL